MSGDGIERVGPLPVELVENADAKQLGANHKLVDLGHIAHEREDGLVRAIPVQRVHHDNRLRVRGRTPVRTEIDHGGCTTRLEQDVLGYVTVNDLAWEI